MTSGPQSRLFTFQQPPTPTIEFSPCKVLAASLRVRVLPQLDGRIVGNLLRNEIVLPDGDSGDWWHIPQGWVFKAYTDCNVDYAPSIPAWTPEPTNLTAAPPFPAQSPTPTKTTVFLATSTPTRTNLPTNTLRPTVTATARPSSTPTPSPTPTVHAIFNTATQRGCLVPPCPDNTQIAATNHALASGTPWQSNFTGTATAIAASPTPTLCRVTAQAGLNLRSIPTLRGDVVVRLPLGASLQLLSGPVTNADGFLWRRVQAGGATGWVASTFIAC